MATIKYLVPYEVAIKAHDRASGKPIVNLHYVKTGVQGAAPPAYGAPIAGGGSTTTLLANILAWWTPVRARLNNNYQQESLVMRAIVGKRYATPLFPITALVSGAPVLVQTGLSHGLLTGNTVNIAGVTAPGTVNANWVVTVLSPTTFTLNGSNIAGAWSGDGMVQRVAGTLQPLYADTETLINTGTGGSLADALPLFATASVRRLNPGVGRHFRSRFSLSPCNEADSVAGKFTTAFVANLTLDLDVAIVGGFINGGTAAASDHSFMTVFAKEVALSLASPFAESDTWAKFVSGYTCQPNNGSLVRRKPKLTAGIA